MLTPRLVTTSILSFLVVYALVTPVFADSQSQRYTIDGHDTFRMGASDLRTEITYTGTQDLVMQRTGKVTHFTATVAYDRHQSGSNAHASGSFTTTLQADGNQHDDADADPDYLTILNQPFSIELDPPTMHDLQGLAGTVPFDVPSPMTGAPLHGSLRRLPDGTINGRRVLGIAFRAHGPLHGSLPDRPDMSLSGDITMNGTAYYAYANALLYALDATLQIDGKVANSGQNGPVTIVYKRTIRPE